MKQTRLGLILAGLMVITVGCGVPVTTKQLATTPVAATDKPNPIPWAGKEIQKPEQFMKVIDGVKHFYIYVEEKEWELMDGVKVPVWAFNGTVPGPEIRVQEGDKVAVHFQNTSSQPHSLHLHGITELAMNMDGVPATSMAVNPGHEHVYEFTAKTTGTHMYHCHVATYSHLDMGMYGSLIVDPKDEVKTWNKEYTLFLDEWDTTLNPFATEPRNYNYFTINGKSFPATQNIEGKVGERVKVRLVNTGYQTYYMHSHGYGLLVTHADGYKLPQSYMRDTLPVGPGERYDVEFTLREGAFPWHSHNLNQVLNNGDYLGGATLLVIGK